MYTRGPVIVMELPEHLDRAEVKTFLTELQPLLEEERPSIVLDCSRIQHMDSAGVEMLLYCLEQAMKRDGDLKLAAVSPASAVILELMRVDKKSEAGEIKFVVIDKPGSACIRSAPEELVRQVIDACCA